MSAKKVMTSGVPWDNKEFMLILIETKMPIVIPTKKAGIFVGRVMAVHDTCIEIQSIQKKMIEHVYFNEIDERIYVIGKLTRYEKGEKND